MPGDMSETTNRNHKKCNIFVTVCHLPQICPFDLGGVGDQRWMGV